jgi:transcriptional regulator with XRE-family HTH domain
MSHKPILLTILGKYESDEALPSFEAAKQIADTLGISVDYLVGEGVNYKFDKCNLKQLQDLQLLEEDEKKTLLDLIEQYLEQHSMAGV